MKKLCLCILSAVLCAGLVACAGKTSPQPHEEETTENISTDKTEESIATDETTESIPSDETTESIATDENTPLAETLQTLFVGVTGYRGSAGSSLRNAQGVCNLLSFAESVNYASISPVDRQKIVSDAYSALSDQQREEFAENFSDICDLMESVSGDYSSVRGIFDDGGVADTMDSLMEADNALTQWETLSSDIAQETENAYASVTTLPAKDVEAFASQVRQAYLDEDWQTISALIRYPITMYPDVKVNNAEEFLSYMSDKTLSDLDRAEMEKEDCKDLFVNGQGICMATGGIWFLDVHFNGLDQADAPLLRIISVSGLDDRN